MKNAILKNKNIFVSALLPMLFQVSLTKVFAQITQVTVQQPESSDDYTWWYVTLIVLAVGLLGTIVWWLKGKKAEKQEMKKYQSSQAEKDWESESLDADKELEWLRKNQLVLDKKKKPRRTVKPEVYEIPAVEETISPPAAETKPDTPLPVFGFQELTPSKSFSPLSISNNESLLSAVEQVQEEDEEDEEVRDLSVKILAAFKNRNSVEALSQVALYDLSSSLRSKAVSVLAEFDHESVFETILLAGADPTREVRAAAARSLSRLSFDRADAWARIAESGEEGRMRQAARAATEGGFVERSFERLVHPDQKYAYEAFVLLALLIRAGEVEPIFEALKNNSNSDVKSALLHLIRVVKNHNALDGLYSLLEENKLSPEFKKQVDKTVEEIGFVMA